MGLGGGWEKVKKWKVSVQQGKEKKEDEEREEEEKRKVEEEEEEEEEREEEKVRNQSKVLVRSGFSH